MVGLEEITKLADKYHRKIHWKNYDDCFINGGDIYLLKIWKEEEEEERRKRVIVSKSSPSILYPPWEEYH